jgi:LacI family transcriptional regulator
MKVKATLKQIAKELNVSVSTVSKALMIVQKLVNKQRLKLKNMQSLKIINPMIGLNLKNKPKQLG